MECKFFIGQKVVCIDAGIHNNYRPAHWPPADGQGLDGLTEGEVYTIRGIGEIFGAVYVQLVELSRYRDYAPNEEIGFAYQRFAPTTDITIFNEILANVPKELEPV